MISSRVPCLEVALSWRGPQEDLVWGVGCTQPPAPFFSTLCQCCPPCLSRGYS